MMFPVPLGLQLQMEGSNGELFGLWGGQRERSTAPCPQGLGQRPRCDVLPLDFVPGRHGSFERHISTKLCKRNDILNVSDEKWPKENPFLKQASEQTKTLCYLSGWENFPFGLAQHGAWAGCSDPAQSPTLISAGTVQSGSCSQHLDPGSVRVVLAARDGELPPTQLRPCLRVSAAGNNLQ